MSGMMVMARHMEGRDIPEDVICKHILPRLPVKTLRKFILVKKTWYAFIKSSYFIRKHLRQSALCLENDCASGYLLHLLFDKNNQEECGQLLAKGPNGYDRVSGVKVEKFMNEEPDLVVVGSCNGLICLTPNHGSKYGQRIYLWNPAIQKFRSVLDSSCNDLSSLTWVVLGCWYSFAENDYKLVRIIVNTFCHVEVYSLSTGSWREMENVTVKGSFLYQRVGVFADGYVNWLAYSSLEQVIVSFDTKKEVFKTFELPIQSASLSAMDYKGSLAVFAIEDWVWGLRNSWSLWIQRKNGEASYWVKLLNVVTQERIYRPVEIPINYEIYLFTNDFHVVAYDIKDQNLKDVGISNLHDFSHWARYSETLVLLDD